MTSPLFTPAAQWPVFGDYDVAVIGAGPGGIGAATSAARLGANTVIIERYGFPGGCGTLTNTPLYMGFAADAGRIVAGLAEEIARRLDAMGQACFVLSGPLRPEGRPIAGRPLLHHVLTSTEAMRIVSTEMLQEAGVARLFYADTIGAAVDDRRITAVALACAEGLGLIRAKCFIDATGEAQLVNLAGGRVRDYSIEESMHKSLFFDVGGVEPYDAVENRKLYEKLYAEKRTPPGSQPYFAVLKKLEPGMAQVCLIKEVGASLRSAELTRMDEIMRARIPAVVEFLRREMPGFTHCHLTSSSIQVGVRGGRGIVGLETLTQQQIDSNAPVDEPIALIHRSYGSHSIRESFMPEWSRANPGVSAVPLKTLFPVDFTNVAVAGRSISLEPRILDTVRLMPRCMTIGQAAGTCAALAVRDELAMAEVNYGEIRAELLRQKVLLEPCPPGEE